MPCGTRAGTAGCGCGSTPARSAARSSTTGPASPKIGSTGTSCRRASPSAGAASGWRDTSATCSRCRPVRTARKSLSVRRLGEYGSAVLLKTSRLVLRPFQPDADLDDAYAYMSDPEVVRYLYWEVRTREQVRAFLGERGSHVLALELPAEGRVIGEVLLRPTSEEHRQ